MRIFFSFGDSELRQTGFADSFAEPVADTFGRVGNFDVQAFLVLRHRHERQSDEFFDARETFKFRIGKGVREFASTVGAEVEENHAVALFHAVIIADNDGDNKFVGNLVVVGFFNRRGGIRFFRRVSFGNGVVGFLHAVPALIAVHCVVATGNRSDLPNANFLDFFFERGEIFSGRTRRNVAPVQKCVHVNFFNALVLGKFQQAVKVVGVAVNAARGKQSEQMQCAAARQNFISDADEGFILEEIAVANRLGNFRQRLVNDAPRANVHVPNFGIAHLPVGKSNVFAGSLQLRVRIFFSEFVENRRLANLNRIVLIHRVANSPAVHDNQTNRRVINFSHLNTLLENTTYLN